MERPARSLGLLAQCAAFALLAFAAALLFPAVALGASGTYSIDELSTELSVQADGSVHVIERQVYTFTDECEGCVWYLHAPESYESVRITGVRVAPVDSGGAPLGEWTKLQAIDCKPKLQGENPGDHAVRSLTAPDTVPFAIYVKAGTAESGN